MRGKVERKVGNNREEEREEEGEQNSGKKR